jgi:MoaA/NifB/PqqE/SkfB family radical SAM enzyme
MLPPEFDLPSKYGFTMKGWDFSTAELRDAMEGKRMLNPAFELASNFCPWNCGFCFTEDPLNTEGTKRRLNNEMTIAARLGLIEQAADLGTRSINFVGAGEPTIDPDFFKLLGEMKRLGITPIVYSEGALKLTDRDFVRRLFDTGATVVLKVNTLEDEAYQNAIVAGPAGRKTPRQQNYFRARNRALEILIDEGFAGSDPTRLAFDTIICKENVEEILRIHRYARRNNIFVLFVNYLPSGRSTEVMHNAITREEQFAIFEQMAEIDRQEFGIEHRACFPYAGGVPCTIRGFGLYVKITGKVFDCPGESQEMGNFRDESLADIWKRAHSIQSGFDGGCLPRKLFWEKIARGQVLGEKTETLI